MPTDMSYQIVFDLSQKQNAAVNEVWKFYSGVALALLAATVGSDKLKATWAGVWALIGGFWLFSLGNLSVISAAHDLAIRLGDLANSVAPRLNNGQAIQIRSVPVWEVVSFHLLCDVALTGGILIIAFKSRAGAAASGT